MPTAAIRLQFASAQIFRRSLIIVVLHWLAVISYIFSHTSKGRQTTIYGDSPLNSFTCVHKVLITFSLHIKHLWGCAIPWIGNLQKKSPVCSMRSPIWWFWFPSWVEKRTQELSNDDVMICAIIWRWCTLRDVLDLEYRQLVSDRSRSGFPHAKFYPIGSWFRGHAVA